MVFRRYRIRVRQNNQQSPRGDSGEILSRITGLPFYGKFIIFEPRLVKTCLREFLTRPDTNQPAQPQKLARVLKFRL